MMGEDEGEGEERLTRRWAAMASSIDAMRARVTMLIADRRGSMPVTMTCRNAEDGVLACRLLERRNGPIWSR